jgi:hypothetical protein
VYMGRLVMHGVFSGYSNTHAWSSGGWFLDVL